MSYSEIIIALENIIVDKVSTVQSNKSRRNDTSAPMQIGMAAKEDGESASQEGDQRLVDLALQAVWKGTDKGKWGFGKGQNWNEKGGEGGKDGGKKSWQKAAARKEEKGKKRVAKEIPEYVGRAVREDTLLLGAEKGENTHLYAVDEDDGENAEESTENEEDLQAWCLLEGSENEQWQEVISKQTKRRVKKDNQASLLSMMVCSRRGVPRTIAFW